MIKYIYAFLGQIFMFGTGMLFYGNAVPAAIISFSGYALPGLIEKHKSKKYTDQLILEFKDVLISVSSSLTAGQSVENAFINAIKDLDMISPYKESTMKKELKIIKFKIDNNTPIREAILDFAVRTKIEDILDFADVFIVCNRTGANLTEVVADTCETISNRFDMSVEIKINTARQKFSQRALGIMPFILVGIMMISWPDYMKPLHTPPGNIIVTFVLLSLGFAWYIGEKITDIRI